MTEVPRPYEPRGRTAADVAEQLEARARRARARADAAERRATLARHPLGRQVIRAEAALRAMVDASAADPGLTPEDRAIIQLNVNGSLDGLRGCADVLLPYLREE